MKPKLIPRISLSARVDEIRTTSKSIAGGAGGVGCGGARELHPAALGAAAGTPSELPSDLLPPISDSCLRFLPLFPKKGLTTLWK